MLQPLLRSCTSISPVNGSLLSLPDPRSALQSIRSSIPWSPHGCWHISLLESRMFGIRAGGSSASPACRAFSDFHPRVLSAGLDERERERERDIGATFYKSLLVNNWAVGICSFLEFGKLNFHPRVLPQIDCWQYSPKRDREGERGVTAI